MLVSAIVLPADGWPRARVSSCGARYSAAGRVVADLSPALRGAQRADEAQLTPDRRLALGRRDLVLFAQANGLTLREGRARLRALAQVGRAPCKVLPADP